MKRILITTAAILAALAVPAAATHKPGHRAPSPGNLSITTKPFVVTFGSQTIVSGRYTGANNATRAVALAEDPYPYGGGYTNVATVNTDANGSYTFRVTPASNRNYRVTVGSDVAYSGVRVRKRVSFTVSDSTPAAGQRVVFSGYVAPKHDGQTALVQRRTATGAWRTVRTTALRPTTTNRSRYSTTLTIRRTGTYRVRSGSDGDHLTGTSRLRTLRVG
jgi:hypothetical protein